MLFIDLDKFKKSTTRWPPVGDALLRRSPPGSRNPCGPATWFARLGATSSSRPDRNSGPADAANLAPGARGDPRFVRDRRPQIVVDASIVIALSPEDERARRADQERRPRLFGAKASGAAPTRFFEQAMDQRCSSARARTRAAQALVGGEFEVNFPAVWQPRDRPHRLLRGAAALEPPERGYIPPDRFTAGRGDRPDHRIGDWVIRTA